MIYSCSESFKSLSNIMESFLTITTSGENTKHFKIEMLILIFWEITSCNDLNVTYMKIEINSYRQFHLRAR